MRLFTVSVLLALSASGSAARQADSAETGPAHVETFRVGSADTSLRLSRPFIVEGSDTVELDGARLLSPRDYLLDRRRGLIRLRTGAAIRPGGGTLVVRYEALPLVFREEYRHREPVAPADSSAQSTLVVSRPVRPFSVDDLFGSGLQKSGSISRGLTLGTNRDLSLNSGFRMQMAGNLAENVGVTASLTDENTPIQPEGTTQTLQEVDKVYVDIHSTDLSATIGDLDLDLSGSKFGVVRRKLQGARGSARYGAGGVSGDVQLSAAAARGKFATNQMQGADGVQGPYRLSGRNNERGIIVIAGTERVTVDGEPVTRGEINDYVIDYGVAEITFTPRRLITHASRITVDFQYTDRQYNRSLLAGRSQTSLLNGAVSVGVSAAREADDRDSPVEASLSDEDKDTLRAAGDDPLKAVRRGAEFVGPGKGAYALRDSVYVYAPEDPEHAVYAVTFSYVGPGRGDYNRIAAGRYGFAGKGKGSYLPIRILPLPQALDVADLALEVRPGKDFSASGEAAHSRFDANTFSDLDDGRGAGDAVDVGFRYAPAGMRVGSWSVGSLDVRAHGRFIGSGFSAFDRLDDVEFDRRWDLPGAGRGDENLREGSLAYSPVPYLTLSGEGGRIARGGGFSSSRLSGGARLKGAGLPEAEIALERIRSDDRDAARSGRWTRQRASASHGAGPFTAGLRAEREERDAAPDTSAGLLDGSFRFTEISPRLALTGLSGMSVSGEAAWRTDDSAVSGTRQRASTTFTQKYGWELSEWHALSSRLDLTLSRRSFTEEFRARGNGDVSALLLRSQSRFNPFGRGLESDWLYEVASERSAKLERVFQRVARGSGNYVYGGDANGNRIVDEGDFRPARFDGDFVALLVPSDELVPVVDLRAGVRIRLNGARLAPAGSWAGAAASWISTESYARVEEKSTEPDAGRIYALHFSSFMNEATTVAGSALFSQDVFLFENNPGGSVRFRFSERRALNRLATDIERSYRREQSVRLKWSVIPELSHEINAVRIADNLGAGPLSVRRRAVASGSLVSEFSYRPRQELEVGVRTGVTAATNAETLKADLNEETLRLTYAIESSGQARLEISREESILSDRNAPAPFELTDGVVPGTTWLWRAGFDYRVTRFLQAAVSYDGRAEGGGAAVHTGRAEVKAFF